MPISARNKLRGKIEEIQLGDIMAHVVVRVGGNLIESAITRRSADELLIGPLTIGKYERRFKIGKRENRVAWLSF